MVDTLTGHLPLIMKRKRECLRIEIIREDKKFNTSIYCKVTFVETLLYQLKSNLALIVLYLGSISCQTRTKLKNYLKKQLL